MECWTCRCVDGAEYGGKIGQPTGVQLYVLTEGGFFNYVHVRGLSDLSSSRAAEETVWSEGSRRRSPCSGGPWVLWKAYRSVVEAKTCPSKRLPGLPALRCLRLDSHRRGASSPGSRRYRSSRMCLPWGSRGACVAVHAPQCRWGQHLLVDTLAAPGPALRLQYATWGRVKNSPKRSCSSSVTTPARRGSGIRETQKTAPRAALLLHVQTTWASGKHTLLPRQWCTSPHPTPQQPPPTVRRLPPHPYPPRHLKAAAPPKR